MTNMNHNSPHIRARYDADGNIVLTGDSAPARPVVAYEQPMRETRGRSWNLLEEPARKPTPIVTKAAEPLRATATPKKAEALTKPKLSVFHIMGTHAKKIFTASVRESELQIHETAKTAGQEIREAKTDIMRIPAKATQRMKKFWTMAQAPMQLTNRKPGRRQQKKITLFLIDTVRFGGTFAVIFGVLFVGINYQSFWQIARAELALGDDIGTEQALSDITIGAKKNGVPALTGSFGRASANILAYLPDVGPFEDRLIIPKLGENVPIVRPSMDALMKEDWKQFEADIQKALHDGVVHYPGSARPGQAGNFFLTGHSSNYPWIKSDFNDVFARLNELDTGDTYSVYYGGDKHTYKIVKKYEVKPNNVSVLDQPSDKRIATLMTCTPVGTTLRRLIVQAEEIDPDTGTFLKVGEKSDNGVNPFSRLEALPI
jgi:LPXTG-site transpeptidase (sortase) family protein